MAVYENHLIEVLSLSTLIIALNIVAIMSGSADAFYLPINEWLSAYL